MGRRIRLQVKDNGGGSPQTAALKGTESAPFAGEFSASLLKNPTEVCT
ncbi:MAG TPA: hypothetical protein VFQ43_01855 [Nitrososphaera sp.]|nr:hypothetical protein [Nitrososphaera sp.]